MTDSNLVQLALVEETQWGVTPVTPAMRKVRFTKEDLDFQITNIQSEEIVTDRQVTDLIATSARVVGGYNFELSYGEHDDIIAGSMLGNWLLAPAKDNAGIADSVVTDIGTTANTFTVVSGGTSFVTGHVVRASGNLNAANNQVFKVASSTATTVVGTALSLVAETVPLATSRLKVVGFQGVAGDITATATGLGSTTLNFTTIGIPVGAFIKIGGTAVGDQFATAADNTWVRVTAITATNLTCDNRPAGWAIDAGAGKTIKVWFGDQLSNGVTLRSWTVEKGFLGQTTPSYLPLIGLVPNNMTMTVRPGAVVNGSFTFLGKNAATASTVSLDSIPDPSKLGSVINAVADVTRIAEGGTTVVGPNWILEFTINSTNSLFEKDAVSVFGLVGVGKGQYQVTGKLTTAFEDVTILNKLIGNVATSVSAVFVKANQAYVLQLPRIKLSGGMPKSGGLNQRVPLESEFTAIKDTVLTNSTVIWNRLEYYE